MACTVCGFSFDDGNVCPACGSDIELHNLTGKEGDELEQAISKDAVMGGPESEDPVANQPVAGPRGSISIPFGIEEAPNPVLYESVPYGIGHAPIVDR
tara:strand:+ start:1810 stop:2103 length:294 start_codon:yes stop_codon:yes gene_type:complete